jgi:hypothetical protein
VNHHKPRRQVTLGITYAVSLVLVFGSVLLSPSVINVALANDMADAPMTKDTITAGSDGDDDNDQGDNDLEDAPVTQDTISAGGGSEDEDDEDNSGQNNNDNNDDKPATEIKDVPNCPAGQENGLFTTCMPIQTCDNQIVHCCGSAAGSAAPTLSDENDGCVNAPLADHP